MRSNIAKTIIIETLWASLLEYNFFYSKSFVFPTGAAGAFNSDNPSVHALLLLNQRKGP